MAGFDEPAKTWLLKNPTHLLRMETLLSVFPDARIIHTHRDPVASVVSMCRLLAAFRGDPRPGSAAARAIGPRQLHVYKRAVEHTMAVRQKFPDQFYDVYQKSFRAKPMEVVRGIYEFFDLELGSEAEAGMHRWITEQPAPPRNEQPEVAEDFGLTEEQIRSEFALYAKRYGF